MDSITITRIDKSTDRVAVTVEYSIGGVVSSESFVFDGSPAHESGRFVEAAYRAEYSRYLIEVF